MTDPRRFLFLVASAREPGHEGNSEWLARRAADALPRGVAQEWIHVAQLSLPPFVDMRHTKGEYPMPDGDMKKLLDASLAATDIVFVSPVYWYSIPWPLKVYIDHWSAWLRVPGLDFKNRMSAKTLRVITTSGNREQAQPMIDSYALCAQFLSMKWGGALWGKGGPPRAVENDAQAIEAARAFLL
jgi:multimeric flavodoxin WrbA